MSPTRFARRARSLTAQGAEVVEVNMPGFDDLIAGSSAIILETKFDLMDYFARPGGAPVKSLREIIDKGLYDKALELRHKIADTASARDTESHRKVLAKQAVVRERIIALLDSLKLDAIAYPTSTRKPVLAGDPQLGGTCALSAQTGLPAITMPAGFTADGLPTGLELLGRPFSDARLVAYAYAFEQAGPRRRPPPAAPPLINGKAPQPVTFVAAAGGATGRFAFEPLSSDLSYTVQLAPALQREVTAVVIRRTDGAGTRVIRRVLGPGMPQAGGWTRLLGLDLDAFHAGRVTMAVFTTKGTTPTAEIALKRAVRQHERRHSPDREMTHDAIAVIDFGGQYAHLIATKIRRLRVLAEIRQPEDPTELFRRYKGIILSGSPSLSAFGEDSVYNKAIYDLDVPILGFCFGHQEIAKHYGGTVVHGGQRVGARRPARGRRARRSSRASPRSSASG